MNKAIIEVKNLKKLFQVAKNGKGSLAKLEHLFRPRFESISAVDEISFEIGRGEKVAFIGPNGAGKSTTIKLLTGIFQPTSGVVRVLGRDPFLERKKIAYQIGTVFGQRSQLWYHLPAFDTFTLLATIYDIDRNKFKERLDRLVEIFQLSPFMARPVKELSLGERMRCELVASLLHNPEVLFLDEPTIGLDIISKDAIRHLIHQRAELDSVTLFLTSHDIADIEKVCDRIILINKGKIVVDDSVKSIKKRFLKHKRITVKFDGEFRWQFHPAISLIKAVDHFYNFQVDLDLMTAQEAVQYFARNYQFTDIFIEGSPLEEIIKRIYQT